jgi:predicted phosphodiesterase
MRLRILSDLHFEFGTVDLPSVEADVVILAGDIHLGREGRRWARAAFSGLPVVYVMGNHEFYNHSLPELTETLQKESSGSSIHVLENSIAEINGFTFLGCTLWTDFDLLEQAADSMKYAESIMSDYSIIVNSATGRRLRARDTARLHADSVSWLRSELAKHDPARTIVVTHHAPSLMSEAPYHVGSALSPAFASNLDELVKTSGVPLWIHGHTHHNVDYTLGSTRVLTNQRGYPDQLCYGFDSALVVDLK